MSSFNAVGWFEIYVQDMGRAQVFYETVLGIKLEALALPGDPGDEDGLQMLQFPGDMERYGANGALCREPGMASGTGGTLVYFGCIDCGVEEARVVAAGGRIQRGKMSIGEYGFIVLAFDTEGNLFGLHSMQ